MTFALQYCRMTWRLYSKSVCLLVAMFLFTASLACLPVCLLVCVCVCALQQHYCCSFTTNTVWCGLVVYMFLLCCNNSMCSCVLQYFVGHSLLYGCSYTLWWIISSLWHGLVIWKMLLCYDLLVLSIWVVGDTCGQCHIVPGDLESKAGFRGDKTEHQNNS